MAEMTDAQATNTALSMIQMIQMQAPDFVFETLLEDAEFEQVMLASASLASLFLSMLPPCEQRKLIKMIRDDLLELEAKGVVMWKDIKDS